MKSKRISEATLGKLPEIDFDDLCDLHKHLIEKYDAIDTDLSQ